MLAFEARHLRDAFGCFATGVTVVTARDTRGEPVGMTVNSFSAVSLSPPLVLWSVCRDLHPFEVFNAAGHFAVHVLHAGQENVSNHFAQANEARFADIEHTAGIAGLPLLLDYSALFQCRVEHRYAGGDHIIVVGRVLAIDHRPAEPLIFHAGNYRR